MGNMSDLIECPLCSSKFCSISDLNGHLVTHRAPKPNDPETPSHSLGEMNRRLTSEEIANIVTMERKRRPSKYPPKLKLQELALYKLTLVEPIRQVEGQGYVLEVQNDSDGMRYSLWLPTVLRSKLQEVKASEGMTLGVIYKGKPKGKLYNDYAVFVWDAMAETLFGKRVMDRQEIENG